MAAPGDYLMQAVLSANQERSSAARTKAGLNMQKYGIDQQKSSYDRSSQLAEDKWDFKKTLIEEDEKRRANARELDQYIGETRLDADYIQEQQNLQVEELKQQGAFSKKQADQYKGFLWTPGEAEGRKWADSKFLPNLSQWWRGEGMVGDEGHSAYDLSKYPGLTVAGENIKKKKPEFDVEKLKELGWTTGDLDKYTKYIESSAGEIEGTSTQSLFDMIMNQRYNPNYTGKP